MENPNKIEIEGLKTIHKLCNFGAEHDMEGCSFTEIVERMFSKIKSMQTQVNTLDEMLLNQGDALAEAKAQAVPEGFVLVPKEPCAYLIKHKLWNKESQPEIYLADDFIGDDGVEREKLIVCIPLYKGDDEAQEQDQ